MLGRETSICTSHVTTAVFVKNIRSRPMGTGPTSIDTPSDFFLEMA